MPGTGTPRGHGRVATTSEAPVECQPVKLRLGAKPAWQESHPCRLLRRVQVGQTIVVPAVCVVEQPVHAQVQRGGPLQERHTQQQQWYHASCH
jgi:hypothetical protein